MATRTPKAAKKARDTKAKAAPPGKPAKAKEPKAKAPKAKAPKGGGRKAAVVYEEPQAAAVPEEPKPGFFDRLRQRRAERAEARAEEQRRRDAERREAEERSRLAEEEQRRLREAAEQAQRERAEAEEQARRAEEAAAERKAKAAAAREAKRAEKDAEEARKAEQAIAEAAAEAERERAEREAKEHRAAERAAKRRALEEEERRQAEEQARRDAEEEAEREAEARRQAVQERLKAEAEGKPAGQARELEPEMEFQEASRPVAPGREMVPRKGADEGEADAKGGDDGDGGGKPASTDAQADLMAAELARRRSKPVVIHEDLPTPPKLPKAPLRAGEEYRAVPAAAKPEVEFTETPSAPAPSEAFGFTLPEAFLLLANEGQWDERAEKAKGGALGGALAGSLLLELLVAKAIVVQRDRFVPTGTVPDDPALYAALERLRRIREKKGDLSSLGQMAALAKGNRELLRPFKDQLAARGLAEHGERRHLGLFHRSWLQVTDPDVQERLQNRLRRAIAGGGTPEPHSVLLLGLLDAVGQFGAVVPDEAADYNRKRLNGLLGGRDIMGYKVHPDLKALQETAVRTVLANVRLMTTRG